MKTRMIVWFSHGAPSAVAAKESIRKYGDLYDVVIANCDTRASEHSDNYRFGAQCEAWFGQKIIYLRNDEFKDVDDVVEKTKYMSGPKGARCTTELKKIPRLRFQTPDDIHVFGFTLEETKRAQTFENRNPELKLKWVLIEGGWTRGSVNAELARAGIGEPEMYCLGFDNNNCPGCLKASSKWYWDKVRTHFPAVFKQRCEQSRKLNVKLVELTHHNRIFLDELPPGPFKNRGKKESVSCGPECGGQTVR